MRAVAALVRLRVPAESAGFVAEQLGRAEIERLEFCEAPADYELYSFFLPRVWGVLLIIYT